jgi:hypothetical protein
MKFYGGMSSSAHFAIAAAITEAIGKDGGEFLDVTFNDAIDVINLKGATANYTEGVAPFFTTTGTD